MNKLEKLKQELEETKNKRTEMEKKIGELEKQINGARWKAQKNKRYYCFDSCGDIREDCDNCYVDTVRYEFGNYFETKEEAENVVEKIKIYTQLKDLALRLNKGEKIDWYDSEQHKYYIYCEYEAHRLCAIETDFFQDIGQIYCLDKDFLIIAKREIGEENLKRLFE